MLSFDNMPPQHDLTLEKNPMLDFFRRYERYFFLVITVVIIISFSFFGTYSTIGSTMWREPIAFKAVNGHDVSRIDVDEMALFLATDNSDKMIYGGVWGPNFLNDGVIQKDFLQTGLAQELALAYSSELQEDFDKRIAKERKHSLYTHPQAPFVGVEGVWNYFAPQMLTYYRGLKGAGNGLDPSAFSDRVNLYLSEKQIPSPTLRYILRYQEKQYADWLKPDERLGQVDLSLFGYHTLEDWFGPRFTRLVSEFIINASILAEEQGYEVSNAEVLTDLVRNTQISYQQNISNPNLGVTSPEEYLSEQLRRLNMDQARAIKIWRQVLLFRRYFHDAGANALVDALGNQKINQFAHESVTVDLYRLPEALRLKSYSDMQDLEAYLYAVTKQNKEDPLALPDQFLALDTVEKKYPELVQKRYILEVSQVNQKALQAKIALRQLWDWEVEEKNWTLLIKQFPTLGLKPGKTREDRYETLESLEPPARAPIDAFAKDLIVQDHSDWIDQALSQATPEVIELGIRLQGGKLPFSGLEGKEKIEAFVHLLDEAPIGSEVSSHSPLYDYTADHKVYYRIAVVDRSDTREILTFEEARSSGALETVRDRILEQYYLASRGKDASLYQDDKKDWKPFKEVKESVADEFHKKIFTALERFQKEALSGDNSSLYGKDQLASLRLYPYLKSVKEHLVKENASEINQKVTLKGEEKGFSTALIERLSLPDQWKVEMATVTVNRESADPGFDVGEAMALNTHEWSSLRTPVNGDLTFYRMKGREESPIESSAAVERAREAQTVLGAEAQRHLMRQVLEVLKSKEAISLAYLTTPQAEDSQPQGLDSMPEY